MADEKVLNDFVVFAESGNDPTYSSIDGVVILLDCPVDFQYVPEAKPKRVIYLVDLLDAAMKADIIDKLEDARVVGDLLFEFTDADE
jgi:hypothetical protein